MTVRLGFAVKVIGVAGLKSRDTRRWPKRPHLSVSLAYLRDILNYLRQHEIHFYRFAPELAPYATHPDLPEFHNQIAQCERELITVGETAQADGVRLSVHPGQHVVLNAPDNGLAERSRQELVHQTQILAAMGLGPEAVVVLHVGGVYGDRLVARERFVRQVETLTPQVRSRLALENDDHRFSVDDCLWIHRQTGVPLTFDYLHFRCHNPDGMTLREALTSCLATWPMGARPKMHFSSPRTSAVVIEHHDATGDRVRRRTRPPRTTQHADYVDPFTFIDLMRAAWSAELKEFDVMLEAKAQDLALLQLREDVARLAPEWVPHLA